MKDRCGLIVPLSSLPPLALPSDSETCGGSLTSLTSMVESFSWSHTALHYSSWVSHFCSWSWLSVKSSKEETSRSSEESIPDLLVLESPQYFRLTLLLGIIPSSFPGLWYISELLSKIPCHGPLQSLISNGSVIQLPPPVLSNISWSMLWDIMMTIVNLIKMEMHLYFPLMLSLLLSSFGYSVT